MCYTLSKPYLLVHLQNPNDGKRRSSSQQSNSHRACRSPCITPQTSTRAGEMSFEDTEDDENDGGNDCRDEETGGC
jgi:hypothetical protein